MKRGHGHLAKISNERKHLDRKIIHYLTLFILTTLINTEILNLDKRLDLLKWSAASTQGLFTSTLIKSVDQMLLRTNICRSNNTNLIKRQNDKMTISILLSK